MNIIKELEDKVEEAFVAFGDVHVNAVKDPNHPPQIWDEDHDRTYALLQQAQKNLSEAKYPKTGSVMFNIRKPIDNLFESFNDAAINWADSDTGSNGTEADMSITYRGEDYILTIRRQ